MKTTARSLHTLLILITCLLLSTSHTTHASALEISLETNQQKTSYGIGYAMSHYHYAKTITGLPNPELEQDYDVKVIQKAIADFIRDDPWEYTQEELKALFTEHKARKKSFRAKQQDDQIQLPPQADVDKFSYGQGVAMGSYITKYSLAARLSSVDPEMLAAGYIEGIQRLDSRIDKKESAKLILQLMFDEHDVILEIIQEKNPKMTNQQAEEHFQAVITKMQSKE